MPRMTTAEAVIETLISHGVDTLFALPGVHNDPLFDAAFKAGERIRVIHPRHEQTAAYMALGAALVTGKPQAFAVVPGPGVLNASAALLLAYAMGAPVIALAGQIPSFAIDQGHGHLHEIRDQIGLLRHIVKQAERIRSPQEASERVAQAIAVAMSGRTGPVALECAIDVWGQAAEVSLTAPIARWPRVLTRWPSMLPLSCWPGRAAADRGGRRRAGGGGGGAGGGRVAARAGVVVPAGQGGDPDRRIRWRCRSPRGTGCGRRPTRCWRSARACTGSRRTGGWMTG